MMGNNKTVKSERADFLTLENKRKIYKRFLQLKERRINYTVIARGFGIGRTTLDRIIREGNNGFLGEDIREKEEMK